MPEIVSVYVKKYNFSAPIISSSSSLTYNLLKDGKIAENAFSIVFLQNLPEGSVIKLNIM